MIAFAVAGYVLFFNPNLLNEIRDAINAALPPNMADTINPIIDQAIAQRNTVAAFGLLAALYSGIGWMTNLREALSEQWAQTPEPPALPKRLLFDLIALFGLGIALVGSFAITGRGVGLRRGPAGLVGLADQGWAQFLLQLLGIVLGLLANFLVFLWVIARLPRQHTPIRSAVKAAVLGAVGFEILKQVMTIYLTSVTNSPSGAVFGSLLGLLVFINFVSRFILFVTAWAATAKGVEKEAPAPIPAPAVIRPEVVVRSGPNNATTAGLLGDGRRHRPARPARLRPPPLTVTGGGAGTGPAAATAGASSARRQTTAPPPAAPATSRSAGQRQPPGSAGPSSRAREGADRGRRCRRRPSAVPARSPPACRRVRFGRQREPAVEQRGRLAPVHHRRVLRAHHRHHQPPPVALRGADDRVPRARR